MGGRAHGVKKRQSVLIHSRAEADACRAGIRTIILPARNRKDAEQDLPADVLADLHFCYVRTFADVLAEVWPEEGHPFVPSSL